MPIEYPFALPTEETSFNLFPTELENDSLVFFHGTADENRESIINTGFRIGGALASVSFASNSGLALRYAYEKGPEKCSKGCVLAVRFNHIKEPEIVSEPFGIHVYKFDPRPIIEGYCIIPETYLFR